MRLKFILLSSLGMMVLFSIGCLKDQCVRTITYTKTTPIYLSPDEYRVAIDMGNPVDLRDQGKIYFYNDFILINELNKGIHFIDNSEPENPLSIGFLSIQGNGNMAIRNNVLYADSYTDLLTIDLQDIMNPRLLNRSLDVFPHFGEGSDGKLLVGYDYETITEKVDCEIQDRDSWAFADESFSPTLTNFSSSGSADQSSSTGVGGSLARFTITHGHMYSIDDQTMRVFDLGNENNPVLVSSLELGWGIETIFPYEDNLFVGANNGMTIYNLDDPGNPKYVGGYSHWTSCDPVFVKDNYAYVTLRSGTTCNGSEINQLDLLDITSLSNPRLVETFEMDNPHGLSIVDDNLFLCEGEFGLKVFDIENPRTLDQEQLDKIKSIHAVDVIAIPGDESIIMVIGNDGLYQYRFDNPRNLKRISFIPVRKS